jgi:hypothetical protein
MFLELTRGCDNRACPSWGTVCDYPEVHFMKSEVLDRATTELHEVLDGEHPFEVVDVWAYGCGDSLDHPALGDMLHRIHDRLGDKGKLSLATDSRRSIPGGDWWRALDKIKVIHKQPDDYDWADAARRWSEALPGLPMSHKLIVSKITCKHWDTWRSQVVAGGPITELKAVPWHDIPLGTDSPRFKPRVQITVEEGVPWRAEPYPGRPVRRVMIAWDGSLRRCLVCPTRHETVRDLVLGEDTICNTCFPLTGGNLVKFHDDYVSVTPSASCVSDGYMFVSSEP